MYGIEKGDTVQMLFTAFMMVPGLENVGGKVIAGDWATGLMDNQIRLISNAETKVMFATPSYLIQVIARARELGIELKQTKVRTVILGDRDPATYANRFARTIIFDDTRVAQNGLYRQDAAF